jgi:hypothetical protein
MFFNFKIKFKKKPKDEKKNYQKGKLGWRGKTKDK